MKKSKFVTTHFKLREKPDFDMEFTSKEDAVNALLEPVTRPLSLSEALDRLVDLAIMQGCRSVQAYRYQPDKIQEIEEIKKYIENLK